MKDKIVIFLLSIIVTIRINATVTERLARSDKKISEIRKNINSKNLAINSNCKDCRGCRDCKNCKANV